MHNFIDKKGTITQVLSLRNIYLIDSLTLAFLPTLERK